MSRKAQDLTGMKFGKWTVLGFHRKDAHGTYHWKCKCDCGREKIVNGSFLRNGTSKSCGGCNYKDLTGMKFGRLIAIEVSHKDKNSHYYWKCKCDCGKTKIISGSSLLKGDSRSCGCLHKQKMSAIGTMNQNKNLKPFIEKDCVEGTRISTLSNRLRKDNTSGHKGVYWDKSKNKWFASIHFRGKQIYLGSYDNIKDAVKARNEAEEKYFKPIIEEYRGNEDTRY